MGVRPTLRVHSLDIGFFVERQVLVEPISIDGFHAEDTHRAHQAQVFMKQAELDGRVSR